MRIQEMEETLMAVNFMGAVFVRVSNLEESIRFYSDILSL